MSRSWKIAIGVVAALVAFNVGLRILRSVTGGSPGGPRSSAYATGADGVAAYASLLARAGHRVRHVRAFPHAASLDPAATAFVLDPDFVERRDADALRSFVERGGRLVAGGSGATRWLGRLVAPGPERSSGGVEGAPLAPVPEVAGVERVQTAGDGSWRTTGAALPAFGDAQRSLLAVAAVGGGRVALLADASPLQNRLLADADNARLGLDLAGPATRPVLFLEAYHGYGESSGFAAIPGRWILLLSGLALAALVLMLARGRRLGPPELEERELPPPRRAYVDALAGVLARSRAPEEALAPVRAETQARICLL
jgi:hypothetical protein